MLLCCFYDSHDEISISIMWYGNYISDPMYSEEGYREEINSLRADREADIRFSVEREAR